MKRSLVLISIFMMVCYAASAQKNKNTTTTSTIQPDNKSLMITQYKMIYSQAISYGDFSSATTAVFGILANDTGDISWQDTLAGLFFARGAYEQCISISKIVYAKQPENTRILEILATAEQSSGNQKDALGYFEQLYPKTKELYHLYQIITLQYNLKRLAECNSNIDVMIADVNSEKQQITLTVGQNQQQKVFFKAAAYNIRGVMARDVKQDTLAEESFNAALKISPDFVLPKLNLDDMHKQQSFDKNISNKTPIIPKN